MVSKRLNRLYLAKRLLNADPNASAAEIMQAVQLLEKKRRDPLVPIGQVLKGVACTKK